MREDGKYIGIYPADRNRVTCTIDFPHPLIGEQSYSLELNPENYVREIAPARTFGFLKDLNALRNMGLIRGASQENCIVLTRDGVVNGPLRYPDEFVRHKVLDLIGDLALLGKRIIGRVVADRAGHAMHTALVTRILRDRTLWEETTEDDSRNSVVTAAPAEVSAPAL